MTARKALSAPATESQPITEAQVNEAWEAYAATQRMAANEPQLLDNQFFVAIQDSAFARFLMFWEAL